MSSSTSASPSSPEDSSQSPGSGHRTAVGFRDRLTDPPLAESTGQDESSPPSDEPLSEQADPGNNADDEVGSGDGETGEREPLYVDEELPSTWLTLDAQSRSLIILALLAMVYSLYFARALILPVALAVILSSVLRPVVRRLHRWHIPNFAAAAIVLLGMFATVAFAAVNLVGPVNEWLENAPKYFSEVEVKFRGLREQVATLSAASKKMENLVGNGELGEDPAAAQAREDAALQQLRNAPGGLDAGPAATLPWENVAIDRDGPLDIDAVEGSGGDKPARREPIPVEIRQHRLTEVVFSTTGSVLASAGVIMVLMFFLLTTGDRFLNRMVEVMPTFREKRRVVEIVRSIEYGISNYLFTVSMINVGLGVAIGLAMWALGMPNPALWGVMATALNFMPYIGALLGTGVVFVAAVLAFDSLAYAAVIPAVYFLLTAIEGNFVTPTLIGRSMSLNPIMVFLSLLFWGWIWGVGGAFLAVPLLAIFKIVADQIEPLQPVGRLLSE